MDIHGLMRIGRYCNMKNIFKKISNKITELAVRTKTAFEAKKAELYVDKGVGIIIAVVVGAVIMAGIYALLKTTVLDKMSTDVNALWSYTGA